MNESTVPFVYFAQAGDAQGPIKIGFSSDVERRLDSLRTGNHLPITLIAKFRHERAPAVERALHARFAGLRLKGEWFSFDGRIVDVIESIAKDDRILGWFAGEPTTPQETSDIAPEQLAVESGHGNWGSPDVPHGGWLCVGLEDLGEPAARCQMCERMEIRYVHKMRHDDYPDVLRVGCICAGHMEQNLDAADRRDKEMRRRASKRNRWLTRPWRRRGWVESTTADGYSVTVYPLEGRLFGATVSGGDFRRHSQRHYVTRNDAKLAAFDVITERVCRLATRAPGGGE